MRWRTWTVMGTLAFGVGCSGSTAGTGEEPVDTGSLLDDTGSFLDDTGTADTGTADSSLGDTGTADGTVIDTGAPDGTGGDASGEASDGTATDTGGGGETGETSTTDTGSADTGSADTGTADTGTADTGAADTGTADTGTADAPVDTGVVGLYPASGKISCSGNGSVMCTGGKICCGRWDLFSLSWTKSCESGCIAGRGFDCDETADCSSGVCCADYAPLSSTISGSTCRSSCGSGEQLCMKDSDCGSTKKCTPIKTPDLGTAVGVCK